MLDRSCNVLGGSRNVLDRSCNVLTKADIAIVGGGPAGARGADGLARRGARVAIYDASHPREKPCGGGVTRRRVGAGADPLHSPGVGPAADPPAPFSAEPPRPA